MTTQCPSTTQSVGRRIRLAGLALVLAQLTLCGVMLPSRSSAAGEMLFAQAAPAGSTSPAAPATAAPATTTTTITTGAATNAAPVTPAPPANLASANTAATNQNTAFDAPDLMTRAGKILFAALVLALVLESALAVVFNWRVFLEFFDGRGVRTLVMIVVAWLVVYGFDKDFIYELLAVFSPTGSSQAPSHIGTVLLSTLVLAGGSASVNRLMVGLGIRDNRTVDQVAPKPPRNRAWVSFKAIRPAGAGGGKDTDVPFRVLSADGMAPTTSAIIGGTDERDNRSRLRQYFWRDVHRVPRSAGFEVVPGQAYGFVIEATIDHGLEYRDMAGTLLAPDPANGNFFPMPTAVKFAPGAIVDFLVRFPG